MLPFVETAKPDGGFQVFVFAKVVGEALSPPQAIAALPAPNNFDSTFSSDLRGKCNFVRCNKMPMLIANAFKWLSPSSACLATC